MPSTTTRLGRPHPVARLLPEASLRAAARSAATLRQERPDVVVRHLQSLSRDQLVERVLAALVLVDVDRPLSELTAWTSGPRRTAAEVAEPCAEPAPTIDENAPPPVPPGYLIRPPQIEHAPWSTPSLRAAHSAYRRGDRSEAVENGEHEYQRRRNQHLRQQRRAAAAS